MSFAKLLFGAAAAPLSIPVMSATSAVNNFKQGSVVNGLKHVAAAYLMATAGNHFIADPQANLADSLDTAFHPKASQMAGDAGTATKKWTSTAFSVASSGLQFVVGAGKGVASGIDQEVQANRTRPAPHAKP